VQVKTNARTFNFWLLSKHANDQVSDTHVYVLVNIRSRKNCEEIEYYVVPSRAVAAKMVYFERRNSEWWAVYHSEVAEFRDGWSIFGAS